MQAGAVVGVADIHARPLAHGIEAAQHLDRIRRRIAVQENCRWAIRSSLVIGSTALIHGAGERRARIRYCAARSSPRAHRRTGRRLTSRRRTRPRCRSARPAGREPGSPRTGPCAAGLVQMGDDLVEQQDGRLRRGCRSARAARQHDRDQQRLLLAGRAVRRGQAACQMGGAEIAAVRAAEGAAGLGIAARRSAPACPRQPVLDGERRHLAPASSRRRRRGRGPPAGTARRRGHGSGPGDRSARAGRPRWRRRARRSAARARQPGGIADADTAARPARSSCDRSCSACS